MKKEVLNSVLIGLLLSFAVVFLFSFLTIFNKNFIRRYLEKTNYYETKYNDIKNEIEYYDKTFLFNLSIDKVKEDINGYVSNNFENVTIYRFENKDINDIYNKNIKIDNYFVEHSNYNKIKIICIVIMIALIIVTFELYLNLKCETYNFLFMSGIFGLIINYLLYKSIYFNMNIVDYMYNKYMFYLLIANIVQIIISVYLYFSINKITVKRR